jgi:hypothetical protein
MNPHVQLVPRPIRSRIDTAIFWLVLLFGGSKSELARFYARFPHALIVLLDNPYELTDFQQRHPSLRCQMFALGDQMTTHALFASSSADQRRASGATANSGTEKGCGGRAGNAHAAARHTLQSPGFQEFLRELPHEALVRTKGLLKSIRIDVLGSTAGAGFNGGHPLVVDSITQTLRPLGRVISVHKNALEPLTFAKVARRGGPNGAASTLSMVSEMTDWSDVKDLLVTKHLALHELTPFLDDSDRRLKFLLFDAVAMGCRQIDQKFSVTEPNDLNDDWLGGIHSREVDFYEGIEQDRLAPQVAKNMLPDLQARFAAIKPHPALVDELRWIEDSEPRAQEPIENVIERLIDLDAETILDAVCKPAVARRFRLIAETAHGGRFELGRLQDEFSVTPERLEDFVARMQLLVTFHARLESELAESQRDQQFLSDSADQLKASFVVEHTRVARRAFGRQRRIAKLQRGLHRLRELSDDLHVRDAEVRALDHALESTSRELAHHRGVITRLESALEEYVPSGSLVKVPEYVAYEQLASAFPQLLRIPSLNPQGQLDLLCGLAATINPDGLAEIVHSNSNRLDDLAQAIVNGPYDVIGPPHGAQASQHDPRPIFVVPPMTPADEKRLKEEIVKLHPGAMVVFYDTLAFGATTMRIRMRRFTRTGELFAGLMGHDLKVAIEDPLAALNSVDDFLGLERFRGRIIGDRVEFPAEDGEVVYRDCTDGRPDPTTEA